MHIDAVPVGMLSSSYRFLDGDRTVAEIKISAWRERGSISVDERHFEVGRDGLTGPFELTGERGRLVTAQKRTIWRDDFDLRLTDGPRFQLGKAAWWGRTFLVRDEYGTTVGSVEPAGWFSRSARVDLPCDWDVATKAFVFFVASACWRRAAASS